MFLFQIVTVTYETVDNARCCGRVGLDVGLDGGTQSRTRGQIGEQEETRDRIFTVNVARQLDHHGLQQGTIIAYRLKPDWTVEHRGYGSIHRD